MKHLSTFLALITLMGCSRNTQVSGVVTNAFTGRPIPGLAVTLWAYNGHDPHDSVNPKKVGETITQTDSEGEYAVEYSGRGIDLVRLEVGNSAQGFCYNYFDIKYSEFPEANHCAESNIVVDQITGHINLQLDHQSAGSDSLFVRVDCDFLNKKGTVCCDYIFENKISVGEPKSMNLPVTAGRFVYIYWGQSRFDNWDAPSIDSVYCEPTMITPFHISF